MKRPVEDDDVAIAIELASMCEVFHCLPQAGGLLDQDPKLLRMIREVIIAKAEKAEADQKQQRSTGGI